MGARCGARKHWASSRFGSSSLSVRRFEMRAIAKRFVRIVSGSASRKKVLEIDGLTAAAIAAALGK